jgi:DNA gyrase/topoisomerase IV subunit A
MGGFSITEEQPDPVVDLTTAGLSNELAELEGRLHVLRGLLDALGRLDELNKAVQFARDKYSAAGVLEQEPFGYSHQQAEAILGMPVSWQTSDEVERLRQERDRLTTRRVNLREQVAEVLALHWFG